jgi:hypothetical protein
MTILPEAARTAIAYRATVSPTEPIHAAIASCRAIARAYTGAARLSPTLAREVDAMVLAARGVGAGSIETTHAAPAVQTVRLTDEDRAAVVAAFAWFRQIVEVLVAAIVRRIGRHDETREPMPAIDASTSRAALPPADVIVTHRPMLAPKSTAIITRSN